MANLYNYQIGNLVGTQKCMKTNDIKLRLDDFSYNRQIEKLVFYLKKNIFFYENSIFLGAIGDDTLVIANSNFSI